MTNIIETTATTKQSNESKNAFKDTMKTFRELIGYEYYTSRVAFEYEGTEVVFVNEGLIGRIRIYVDGTLVVSRYPLYSDASSDTSFSHQGKEHRVISRITNWLTGAQEVTLYTDGREVGRKTDPRLAALTWKQLAHFVGGITGLGLLVGLIVARF